MILSAVEQFNYVKALGEDTAIIVRELTEGANLAVYEDDSLNVKNDAELLASYKKAIEACRTWLKAVLAVEVIDDSEKDISAEVSLRLPDRQLEVSVYTSEFPFGGGNNSDKTEKIHTPIGEMSWYTYRLIVDTPDNPVKELYIFFQRLLHQIHQILTMPNHLDGQDDILRGDLLEEEGIVDVLNISRYDALWYDVEEFLTDKFAVKGVE